ncbi:MAG: multidrug resistance protein [Actinobacteria bacterium]|nr:multidrug resistance protein [Actinomycetota bacterium]MBM3711960.1 multidrug resistance protein [Actinomycetota bacterium]
MKKAIKKERSGLSLTKSILLILLSIGIAVGGQILLKIGMNKIGVININSLGALGHLFIEVFKSPLVLIGLFCYVISAAIWLVVLSAVDLSFAYPFIGLTYVLILIVSKFVLKEDVNPIRWAGAAIITVGVVVISRG